MKLIKITIGLFVLVVLLIYIQDHVYALSAFPLNKISSKPKYAKNQLIIKYKTGQSPDEIDNSQKQAGLNLFLSENGITHSKKISLRGYYLLSTNGKKPVETLINNMKSRPEVENVEYNAFRYSLQVTPPNDPYFSYLWNLSKLQILFAWSLTKGNNAVKVAVIDTGVDYTHLDFAGRTFVNGYDFVNTDNDPMDDNGHGTHVAGTIGAVVNNGTGASGINWNISIMPLKALSSDGGGYLSDITDAITYAADNGAKVINISLGGDGSCSPSGIEQQAINYAYSKGATVVVATGNDNADATYYSPASCTHVISVAAVSPLDKRSYYSNYGSVVDLAAPGGDDTPCTGKSGTDLQNCYLANMILSLWPGNQYYFSEGTSMAAPHVSGVAALLLSLNGTLSPDQIKTILKNNIDPITPDPGKTIGTGRLNAYKTLQAVSLPTPTPTTRPTNTPTPTNSPTPTPRPADVNRDGRVNLPDALAVLQSWLTGGTVTYNFREDINKDGKTNSPDFTQILKNWGL